MNHNKDQHTDTVPFCRQFDNCMFGARCWYKHDLENVKNGEMNNSNTNNELIKKLIDMMEKFSNRIVNIENNMN